MNDSDTLYLYGKELDMEPKQRVEEDKKQRKTFKSGVQTTHLPRKTSQVLVEVG